MKKLIYFFICSSFLSQTAIADILLCEDFEDSFITYTTNITEASNGDLDFFGRVALDGISISPAVAYTNIQGNGFFAAMDTDSLSGNPDVGILSFTVDISGFTNLSFSGLFAEDDADDGNQDWDANTSFLAQYAIDGGTFQNLVAFESTGGTNTEPAEDTDFDGVGDGSTLTNIFTEYQTDISDTGNELTLQLILSNFGASDEDIAFDNIYLTGDQLTSPVPLPGAVWMFISAMAGIMTFRRKP